MANLKERNDEIVRRWEAGENHIDLAHEFNRSIDRIKTLIRRRDQAKNYVPGPSNKERGKQNRKRDEDIILRRAAGVTYGKLADDHNLCRERVRQIWMRHLRKCGDPRGLYGPKLWARMQQIKRTGE